MKKYYFTAFGLGQLMVLLLAFLPREMARLIITRSVPVLVVVWLALGCVLVARRMVRA